MRGMLVVVTAMLLVGSGLGSPAAGDVVGESVGVLRCTEGSDIKLPKKMEMLQTVVSGQFATRGQVGLFVDMEFEENAVDKGKLVITASRVLPNGSETRIGKLTGKVKSGRCEELKIVDGVLDASDGIRWKVKLKKLPSLDAALDECWELTLGVFVADEIPD